MKKFVEKNYKIIVGAILGFMLVVSLLNAWNDSAIFDETAHIGAAYSYVTQHEIRLNPEHPPLIKDLAGLPLLFLNLKFDVSKKFWSGDLPGKWDEGQWAAGRSLLYESGNNPDLIIFWSRVPIVLLSVILGLFIFFWARRLAGLFGGLFALILYAFDPNILGHNHFVTTDLGIAAFVAFAFYFFFKFLKDPAWKNVFWAGIFLGLVLLAKFSAIIILPILGLATLIYPLVRLNRHKKDPDFVFKLKSLGQYLGKAIIAGVISLVVVWIVYAGNNFKMSQDTASRVIEANFPAASAQKTKDIYFNKFLHGLNASFITRPLAEYGIGFGYVFRRVSGGNGAYFFGQVSSQAFPAYFPTVFLIKEPIPTLFLMLFALGLALSKIFRAAINDFRNLLKNIFHYLRVNILEFSMFSFIILYAYVSITGNLNIGFRHLFPILPFIYILTAKNIFEFWEKRKAVHSGLENNPNPHDIHLRKLKHNPIVLPLVVGSLLAFLVIETIAVYPSYMSYFNASAGGPKNGYHYVTDSNADWGQDLKRLRNWVVNYNNCLYRKACKWYLLIDPNDLPSKKPIDKIRVDYFGGGNPAYYLKEKYKPWSDDKRPIEAGWYAISTNFLMGSLYEKNKPDNASYRWLKNKKPVSQAGTSILIYYITPEEAAAFSN